jgi:hypothetical protein
MKIERKMYSFENFQVYKIFVSLCINYRGKRYIQIQRDKDFEEFHWSFVQTHESFKPNNSSDGNDDITFFP